MVTPAKIPRIMGEIMNSKPTYQGGQQQTAAVNNNNKGITLSKGAIIGGVTGCVLLGAGLGVAGCSIFGNIKQRRAERKAAKAAKASDKKE